MGGVGAASLALLPLPLLLLLLVRAEASALHGTILPNPAPSPSSPPEARSFGPRISPSYPPRALSPGSPDIDVRSHSHKPPHHRESNQGPSPSSAEGCSSYICTEPLTATPIGSPCGCVEPISVIVDLDLAPYLLFMSIAELEVEVAAGTFLKQSQVKIMAAVASIQDDQKTRVTIYLVPLREEFDTYTASLISDRFRDKKVQINSSIFGDYKVINVSYHGLQSPPSSVPGGSDPSGTEDPITAEVPDQMKKHKKSDILIVVVALGSSLGLLLTCAVVLILLVRWKKLGRLHEDMNPATTPTVNRRYGARSTLSTGMVSSASASAFSTVATCTTSVKTFSLGQLQKATDGFDSRRVLGQGGFGCVYHGTIEDGNEIAVKLLTREDRSGDREFIAEVEMLSRLHHRNLVKLIGICVDRSKRCLVYELIRNGSVESHLHGADKAKGKLNWDVRMKIALGAARGLAYLHEDSNPHVIHRDFKASNILLEEDFTPKVTDFGLAREASNATQPISTRVMGTFGYVAPEYAMTGHLLVKSDVYSYGVVLLELLSGRKPVSISESKDPENLVTWARPLLSHKEGLEKLIDPSLEGNFNFDNVAKVASIASMCVHADPSQRPFMGEAVQALKLIYSDPDEACDDSYSPRNSSDQDGGYDGDLVFGSGSWGFGASGSGCLDYRNSLPFVTMDYSSGRIEGPRDPRAALSAGSHAQPPVLQNRSGPLRVKKKLAASYRSRGSVSEHGHLPRH
ncbi:protein kinase superfamily protein isoform X1 [Zea mays]|uniref:Receptor-like serine/threonine-protein kinase ALE2 n=1 Tax=Zea mays TaxID=4577 RepID=A0A1D6QAY7_MAIZE|nr:protein kinase superfamily protein isoform X1 [Zea mays]AQK55476.1 Receptor-like serine/threonine-protein kinase ALE2 [Zea mays]AQK55481.1 Receptor-like serine/threonine-protein kinase ALE2 [Zea mays]|eukprot:XP_008677136.1 protein kinase superfamily protein isoform X1 [Zea mays]